MKGQSAIEAMLILAAFFVVMGVFAGLYVNFAAKETSLSRGSRMKADVRRVANAVNDVYVLGPKNSIQLELNGDYSLSSAGQTILLSAGQISANATVFTPVEIRSSGQKLLVENIGGKIVISSE